LPTTSWEGTKVGIGTSNPTEKLHVQGAIRIVDGNEGAGKVLTSDASGRATWQAVAATGGPDTKRFAEIVKTSAATALVQNNPINFGTASFAEGITANNNNFQVQVSGIYRVSYTVTISRTSNSGNVIPRFYLSIGWNTTEVPGSSTYARINNGNIISVSTTNYVQLTAWQQLYLFTDTSASNYLVQPQGTTFNIELVRAL